jgi:hypothetical protein
MCIECTKRRRGEDVDGEARSVSWANVAARGSRVTVKETEVISVGLVERELRSAETRTGEIGREVGAPEAIVGLQEMEGMVI